MSVLWDLAAASVAAQARPGAPRNTIELRLADDSARAAGLLLRQHPELDRQDLAQAFAEHVLERLTEDRRSAGHRLYSLYFAAFRHVNRKFRPLPEAPLSGLTAEDADDGALEDLLDLALQHRDGFGATLGQEGGEGEDLARILAVLYDLGPHYVLILVEMAMQGQVDTDAWMEALGPKRAPKWNNWIHQARVGAVLRFLYLLWAEETLEALLQSGADAPLPLLTNAHAPAQGRLCFELRYATPGVTSDRQASVEARARLNISHEAYVRKRRAYARWFIQFLQRRSRALGAEYATAFENYCDLPENGEDAP